MIDKTSPLELPQTVFAWVLKTSKKERVFTNKQELIRQANYYFAQDIFPQIIELKTQDLASSKYIFAAKKFGFEPAKVIWLVDRLQNQFYCLQFLEYLNPEFDEQGFYIRLRFGKIDSENLKIEWKKTQKRELTKTPQGLIFQYEGLSLYLREFQNQLIKN